MLVKAKELSNISLDPVSISCRSDLFLHNDAKSVKAILVLLEKEDEVLRVQSFARFHRLSEILSVGDPLLL